MLVAAVSPSLHPLSADTGFKPRVQVVRKLPIPTSALTAERQTFAPVNQNADLESLVVYASILP